MYIVERSMAALSGDWFFVWGNNMVIKLICFVCKKVLVIRHKLIVLCTEYSS